MVAFDKSRMPYLAVAGIASSFILLVVGFLLALRGINANQRANDLITHTYSVKDTLSQLGQMTERAEAARRGYLLDQRDFRMGVFESSSDQIMPLIGQLQGLTIDNPSQQEAIEELERLARREVADLRYSVNQVRRGRLDAARADFARQAERSTIRQIRERIATIERTEDQLLADRLTAEEASLTRLRVLLALIGLLIIASGLGTFVLLRRNARELAANRDELKTMNLTLESQVEERTSELRRANDEIQRFAYIVSHDLRSPLVNILGFTAELDNTNKVLGKLIESAEAEAPGLITQEVREAHEDLPESIGFIRSSTQKMDRLINAILKLSREGRRTLTPELLPMDHVVEEIVASLDVLIEQSGARVDIDRPLPDLTSDRVAIEQIFSNLIENAIKYGDPERPTVIRVRGETGRSKVHYDIIDNGRGIDPKDHQRVFDLFRRSGKQDKSGEGIGLAQVRALAQRLGGTIDLESQLGQGSTFRLTLPMTYVDRGMTNE